MISRLGLLLLSANPTEVPVTPSPTMLTLDLAINDFSIGPARAVAHVPAVTLRSPLLGAVCTLQPLQIARRRVA
jgi:hypothetical protein